jgi:predicted regulator of Ras-like GTPase activity (Roadblock/LC7/MglB family)
MIQSYTISTERSQPLLRRIADLPGVRHVAVLDAAGLCLAHTGHEPVSTMLLSPWTVVARAAFAACDELGQRCGAGPCQESLQTNRDGGTLMRALSGGMLLIIQYDAKTPVGNLRLVVAEVALDLPVPIEARPPVQRRQQPAQDPFAGNQWASDASTRQPGHRPQPTVVVDA